MTDGVSAYRISEEVYEITIYLSETEIRRLKQLYPGYDIEAAIHKLIHDAYYASLR